MEKNTQHTGSLRDASHWQYNNREEVKALPDDQLKAEWANIQANGKAFSAGNVPWTDELFWCFLAFGDEIRARKLG